MFASCFADAISFSRKRLFYQQALKKPASIHPVIVVCIYVYFFACIGKHIYGIIALQIHTEFTFISAVMVVASQGDNQDINPLGRFGVGTKPI